MKYWHLKRHKIGRVRLRTIPGICLQQFTLGISCYGQVVISALIVLVKRQRGTPTSDVPREKLVYHTGQVITNLPLCDSVSCLIQLAKRSLSLYTMHCGHPLGYAKFTRLLTYNFTMKYPWGTHGINISHLSL